MNVFSRILKKLPLKRLSAAGMIALAIALPVSSMAAAQVEIEGSIGVANATQAVKNNTPLVYGRTTAAKYDEVVKVQVYYHNKELENSGKIAENLTVKINVPTAKGATQTISQTTKADNSNTVTDSATVTLDGPDASIQYIPGTAVWKHNIGSNAAPNYVETAVSDNIVYSPTGLTLEDTKPCFNYSATVSIQVRVVVPGVQIDKTVAKSPVGSPYSTKMNAVPGETVKYSIHYKNTGNTSQNNVIIRDSLPPKMTLVPNSTYIINQSNPKTADKPYGTLYNSNNVTGGGINVGNYAPGADVYVTLFAKLDAATAFECGKTELSNVGVAHPAGMNEFYNTAIVNVDKVCAEVPAYACELLTVSKEANRTVKVTDFKQTTTNGATFKFVSINWGDGSTSLQTDAPVNKTHQYAADGTYNITATAHFSVNGATVTNTSSSCAQPVSFTAAPTIPTKPTTLVNTGPGEVAALFTAVAIASAFAHRLFLGRRLSA